MLGSGFALVFEGHICIGGQCGKFEFVPKIFGRDDGAARVFGGLDDGAIRRHDDAAGFGVLCHVFDDVIGGAACWRKTNADPAVFEGWCKIAQHTRPVEDDRDAIWFDFLIALERIDECVTARFQRLFVLGIQTRNLADKIVTVDDQVGLGHIFDVIP